MDTKTIGGLAARQLLTVAAGWLAARGILAGDGSQAEAFIGGGLLFSSVVWSVYQKWKATRVAGQLAKMGHAVAPQSATDAVAAQMGEKAVNKAQLKADRAAN
jgi:hypothetical protein